MSAAVSLSPLLSPLRSPLQSALRSPLDPRAGGAAAETFYLLDESSNILTDESGNSLTWS